MKGNPAIYKGRIVSKENFRTFVYDPNGKKKIVESWEAFEAAMESGIWFATVKDAKAAVVIEEPKAKEVKVKTQLKPKTKPKPKPKPAKVEEAVDELNDDGMVFEVTDENK